MAGRDDLSVGCRGSNLTVNAIEVGGIIIDARAVLVATHLRPGGGPAGYAYNLIDAFKAHERSSPVRYEFIGTASNARTQLSSISPLSPQRRFASLGRKLLSNRAELLARRLHFDVSSSARRRRETVARNDVLILHGCQPQTVLVDFAKRRGMLIIYMPHSPTPAAHETLATHADSGLKGALPSFQSKLDEEARLIERADCVVFPCPEAAEPYVEEFPQLGGMDVRFLLSGVPEPPSSLLNSRPPGEPKRALFVGRYVSQKGFDLYDAAAALLPRSEILFQSMGAGPLRPRHAHDLGWQARPWEHIRRADVIVIPNRVAYYDLLPLECAALAKPLILTPVGGNLAQARLLPDSILADACTPSAIATSIGGAVERLLEDDNWGGANRAAYERYFRADLLLDRWNALVLDLCQPRRGGS